MTTRHLRNSCDRRRSCRSRLVLLRDKNSLFHLDIPLVVIESLCYKPLKSLHRTYPVRNRYTLQWLINPDPANLAVADSEQHRCCIHDRLQEAETL